MQGGGRGGETCKREGNLKLDQLFFRRLGPARRPQRICPTEPLAPLCAAAPLSLLQGGSHNALDCVSSFLQQPVAI
jgi:hypothetical protein